MIPTLYLEFSQLQIFNTILLRKYFVCMILSRRGTLEVGHHSVERRNFVLKSEMGGSHLVLALLGVPSNGRNSARPNIVFSQNTKQNQKFIY